MSAGAVFQEALRRLNRLDLPGEAASDLLVALEAGRRAPLELVVRASADASLEREVRLARSAAIYFSFCAGNLADDLIDGDCRYYAEPIRIVPSAQFLLQNLFFATAASDEAQVPARVLSSVAAELARAAGPQHVEVRTRDWTAGLFRQVAEGIAGRQWSAYLQLLFAGTALAEHAAQWGMDLGVAGHTALDVRSNDRRFFSMSEADRAEVRAWANEACARLRQANRPWLTAAVEGIAPALETPQ